MTEMGLRWDFFAVSRHSPIISVQGIFFIFSLLCIEPAESWIPGRLLSAPFLQVLLSENGSFSFIFFHVAKWGFSKHFRRQHFPLKTSWATSSSRIWLEKQIISIYSEIKTNEQFRRQLPVQGPGRNECFLQNNLTESGQIESVSNELFLSELQFPRSLREVWRAINLQTWEHTQQVGDIFLTDFTREKKSQDAFLPLGGNEIFIFPGKSWIEIGWLKFMWLFILHIRTRVKRTR